MQHDSLTHSGICKFKIKKFTNTHPNHGFCVLVGTKIAGIDILKTKSTHITEFLKSLIVDMLLFV